MIRFEDLLEKVRAYSRTPTSSCSGGPTSSRPSSTGDRSATSGEPYLIHPLAVADFLADMKLDVVAIAAGLLHDVVEDTLTTIERIQELFGPEVAHVVEGVTKISAISFLSSEERQAENFRKMLLAMVDDIRVILVKLADRLHNMRTLSHLPEDRRIKIAQETRDIYAPIANRLGMSKVKNELEELSFRYLEPQTYEALRARVDAKRRATEGLIDELKKTITAKLAEAQVPVIEIDGRIKRLWSISQKLKRQKIELEQVYDFIALRIVTENVKDCYATLGIIHQTWSPVPGTWTTSGSSACPPSWRSTVSRPIRPRRSPFSRSAAPSSTSRSPSPRSSRAAGPGVRTSPASCSRRLPAAPPATGPSIPGTGPWPRRSRSSPAASTARAASPTRRRPRIALPATRNRASATCRS